VAPPPLNDALRRGDPVHSPFARAADALHLLFGATFLTLALAAFARGAPSSPSAVLLFGTLLAAATTVAGLARRTDAAPLRHLHLALALLVLPVVFAGLGLLVPALPERRFDAELAAFDRALGVDVPRWSERVLTPALADVMMVFYFLYFLMPLVLLGALVRDRVRIYRASFTIALGLYASYLGYLVVPAYGPRPAYAGLSAPLPEGMVCGRIHDFILALEPQPFDAFPSAHVVLGTLCAAAAWPVGGWLRWSMAVVAAGTIASTVFLRYHYAVDDLAGFAVAAVALLAERLLARRAARKAAASHDRMGELLGGP